MNRFDRRQAGPLAPRRARGLTLIELLVTVVILAGMILGFSVILSSARDLVATSQGQMRANRSAQAIGDVIREDFAGITKEGFLAIRDEDGNAADGPAVIFTSAGYKSSQLGVGDSEHGLGAVGALASATTYGVCRNRTTGGAILFRRAMLLQPITGTAHSEKLPQDMLLLRTAGGAYVYNHIYRHNEELVGRDLGDYRTMSPDQIAEAVADELLDPAPSGLFVPPRPRLGDVMRLWQCLTAGVQELHVAWTYGSTDGEGNLEWETWGGSGDDKLWTHHEPDAWPIALRLRFSIVDDSALEAFANTPNAVPYEVTVPIGR